MKGAAWFGRAATAGIAVVLCAVAPSSALDPDGLAPIEAAYAQNRSLHAYTFALHATLTMRSFPWLRFRLNGVGEYVRGERYDVRFMHMPFFARAFSRLDLAPLAPSLWSSRYTVTFVGQRGAESIYALRDPKDQTLRVALVSLNSNTGVDSIDVQYVNGGDVRMTVIANRSSGYLLPVAAKATVNVPAVALSVRAAFTAYQLPQGVAARPGTR